MEGECLDYRAMPGQNSLFLDYLYDSDKVRSFYSSPPPDHRFLVQRASSIASRPGLERRVLLESVRELNETLRPSAAMNRSMNTLAGADAVAVVTGQQVGLFGGPAYSVYKALSAIKLCQLLAGSGIKAVPVFWLAGDDSDFEEVRVTSTAVRTELVEVRYEDRRTAEDQMAGTVSLEAIGHACGQLVDGLKDLPFGTETQELLALSYSSDRDFSSAFARWMRELLGDQGLVFFDPSRGAHRAHLGSFYQAAINNRDEISQHLLARGRDLTGAGYNPQVHVEDSETLLFLRRGNRRFKLKWEHGKFASKGAGKESFSAQDLSALASDDATRLSHGVLLRPILQDYLFPTVAYVGGPAEIAYFGQLSAIAHFWDRAPTVLPRASFTLVDRLSQRFLKTHGIPIEAWLTESTESATERVLKKSEQAGILDNFDELRLDVARRMEALGRDIGKLDPPLSNMVNRSHRRMAYHLEKVRSRFIDNYRLREPSLDRHLTHLSTNLRPLGAPQERELNFNQFLAAEGLDLPARLLKALDPYCFSHNIVSL